MERTHSQIRNPSWTSFPVLIYSKIRNSSFTVSYLQENKKLGSRYTEFSVECTHHQVRNPAWTSFPVLIHRKIRNWGVFILNLSVECTHSQIRNPSWTREYTMKRENDLHSFPISGRETNQNGHNSRRRKKNGT